MRIKIYLSLHFHCITQSSITNNVLENNSKKNILDAVNHEANNAKLSSSSLPAPFLHLEGRSGFVFLPLLFFFIISIFFPGTRPGHADEATGRIERYPGGGCVFAHAGQAKSYSIPAIYGTISSVATNSVNRFPLGAERAYVPRALID